MAAVLLAGIAGCGKSRLVEPATFVAQGLSGTVRAANERSDDANSAIAAICTSFDSNFARLDPRLPSSDVAKINRVAASARWPVRRETFRAINLAHEYSRRSEGAYDLAAGSVRSIWGEPARHPLEERPDPAILEGAAQGSNFRQVELFDDGAIAFLSNQTRLDPARLLFAYSFDIGISQARKQNLGYIFAAYDDMWRVTGQPIENPWTVPVTNPFSQSNMVGRVLMTNALALVSENLDRHVYRVNGHELRGVIDARSGLLATNTAAVWVLAPSATMGAAVSYSLMVVGVNGAPDLLASFERCDAAVIPNAQPIEIWMTEGFAARCAIEPPYAKRTRILTRSTPESQFEDEVPGDEPAGGGI